tara:strand:- start:549 stop:824 length:276 start_codon:yes stop_codon:yes gene_type:complete
MKTNKQILNGTFYFGVLAEWKTLNKHYGVDEMSIMFKDYSGYADIREKNTFQEVFDELKTVKKCLNQTSLKKEVLLLKKMTYPMNINYENR